MASPSILARVGSIPQSKVGLSARFAIILHFTEAYQFRPYYTIAEFILCPG